MRWSRETLVFLALLASQKNRVFCEWQVISRTAFLAAPLVWGNCSRGEREGGRQEGGASEREVKTREEEE